MPVLVAGGADPSLTMPNGADAVMLAAGMGSSRTASRRGIETIDFGKVEPESRVRDAVAAAVGLRRRRECGEPDRRHRAARRGRPRIRHGRAVPRRTTAPASA